MRPLLAGHRLCPIGARAHTKFRAESTVEVGDVAEAAIKRDLDNFCAPHSESQGSITEPRPSQVLMGSDAGETLECPKEVKDAQSSFLS
jgi:hypothetical protein